MASVNADDGVGGKRNNFEAAVAHILPYDPVAKKKQANTSGNKSSSAYILSTEGAEVGATDDGGGKQRGNQVLARLVSTFVTTSKLNTVSSEKTKSWS